MEMYKLSKFVIFVIGALAFVSVVAPLTVKVTKYLLHEHFGYPGETPYSCVSGGGVVESKMRPWLYDNNTVAYKELYYAYCDVGACKRAYWDFTDWVRGNDDSYLYFNKNVSVHSVSRDPYHTWFVSREEAAPVAKANCPTADYLLIFTSYSNNHGRVVPFATKDEVGVIGFLYVLVIGWFVFLLRYFVSLCKALFGI